ncbi:hypothetical protein DFH11DRAFT_74249 [Phellopilus nigrolimitatus]|nr:hypothetical protein DFH11DRAFT_74249 [Phellopilus nigrolimitatus]
MGKRKKTRKAKEVREESYTTDGIKYDVEVIKAVRPLKAGKKIIRGKYEYLVQWAGYPGEDTWEPYSHLIDCDRLLHSMWACIGAVDPCGTKQINLPPEWIVSEEMYFSKLYNNVISIKHHQPCRGYVEGKGYTNIYDN